MDRRLAAIAGGVLAAAGALGMFSRRHAVVSVGPAEVDPDMPLADLIPVDQDADELAPAADQAREHVIGIGWSSEQPIDIDQAIADAGSSSAPLPSPFYEEPQTKPLADVLAELVSGYSIDAGKALHLRLALRDLGDAIEAGRLEEGTVMVDFDWSPGAGLLMNLVVAVLATRNYVRINVSDLEGNLRAPELDVHIRGHEVHVAPDKSARTVDLEERRSEAVVTSLKLKALREGIAIHPGSAADVLTRCRIASTPFPN